MTDVTRSNDKKRHGRLVLSRRVGQSIILGAKEKKITITVVETDHRQTKLSIESPKEVPVNRQEIAEKKGLL